MTVAFGAKGTTFNGTTSSSFSVAFPTGITAGQKLVLCVFINKSGGLTVNTPSNWDEVSNSPSPLVTSNRVSVFTKVATGSESGSQTVTTSTAPTGSLAFISRYTTSLGLFDPDAAASGTDSTTDYDMTTDQTVERVSGDLLIGFACGNGATLRTWTSETIATAAVTAARENVLHSTTAMQAHVSDAVAPSTTTATVRHFGDLNSNMGGSGVVLRLRDVSASVDKSSVGILYG
jgi:hypothetical protein